MPAQLTLLPEEVKKRARGTGQSVFKEDACNGLSTTEYRRQTTDVAGAGRLDQIGTLFPHHSTLLAHQGASLPSSPLTRAWMLLAGLDRCHADRRVDSKAQSSRSWELQSVSGASVSG